LTKIKDVFLLCPILRAMKCSALKHAVLSRLLVGLLIAGLAAQWMTSAVGMGSGGAGIVLASSLDNAADRVLVDLAASVCSKDKSEGGQVKVAHCQHCVPAAFHLLAAPDGERSSRLALAVPIGPAFHSQILPPSRRQPGDGLSRAPPSFA
jgi:hypothetical protein